MPRNRRGVALSALIITALLLPKLRAMTPYEASWCHYQLDKIPNASAGKFEGDLVRFGANLVRFGAIAKCQEITFIYQGQGEVRRELLYLSVARGSAESPPS